MHYGASKPQITLHTGYYQVGTRGNHVTFAPVSDSLQHGPAAICEFMTPFLEEIQTKHSNVDYIQVYSDGPSTQYRQKKNFFFLATEIIPLGYKGASWNFHGAGPGKGIPDGIGGTLKRAADKRVLYGADITNSYDFITELEKSGSTIIALYQVEEENMDNSRMEVPADPTIWDWGKLTGNTEWSHFHRYTVSTTRTVDSKWHSTQRADTRTSYNSQPNSYCSPAKTNTPTFWYSTRYFHR